MKSFLWLLVLPLWMACTAPVKPKDAGKVVSIADGDTFTLLTSENKQVKVRLYGIDCPEKAQAFGTVARQKLSELAFGQQVALEEKDKDRYGRTVAIVYNEKGTCINEQLLKEGLAWHYKEYDQSNSWNDLEAQARKRKIGIWSMPEATPPWEWRKARRAAAEN